MSKEENANVSALVNQYKHQKKNLGKKPHEVNMCKENSLVKEFCIYLFTIFICDIMYYAILCSAV